MKPRHTMSPTYRSSRPCKWNSPRNRDARHMTHGPILPMEEPRGFLARLLGRSRP